MLQSLPMYDPMEVVGFPVWAPSVVLNSEYASTNLWERYKEAWGFASSLLNSVYSFAWNCPEQPWKQVAAEAEWRKEINTMLDIMYLLSSC